MYKKTSLLLIVSIFLFLLASCSKEADNNQLKDQDSLQVTVSIYPLYFLVSEIGRDRVEVESILPSGSNPHFFEPTAKQIATIQETDVFIYSGLQIDSYAEKITESLSSDIEVIQMANQEEVQKRLLSMASSHEHHDHKHDEEDKDDYHEEEDVNSHHHDHESDYDPHIWLGLDIMKEQTLIIQNKLRQLDPQNADFYQENAKELINRFDSLQEYSKEKIGSCNHDEIVVSHAAFGYIAFELGIEQHPISGISPDLEPSSQTMVELLNLVKEQNIDYIMTEDFVSQKVADTLAQEAGIKTLTINPLETVTNDQLDNDEDYLSIMKENIDNIIIALDCQS